MITALIIQWLSLSSIYILFALGFALVFGICKLFNFAHGELYMLGAFFTYYLYAIGGLNYFAAIALSAISVGLIGLAMQRGVFYQVRGHSYATFMVAIALSMILSSLAQGVFGTYQRAIPTPFPGTIQIGTTSLSWERIATIIASVVLIIAVNLLVTKTKLGLAFRAVSQNQSSASLQGMSVHRTEALGFIIGAALAGLAGSLVAPLFPLDVFVGGSVMFRALIVVLLGGLGNIYGAIVGGIVLGLVDTLSLAFLGTLGYIVGWILVIIMICFRPLGLIGKESM